MEGVATTEIIEYNPKTLYMLIPVILTIWIAIKLVI